MKIVSSAKMSEKHQLELKEIYPNGEFYFFENMDEAINELNSAHVLVTYGVDVTETVIEKAAQLRWIHVISAGIDRLPFEKIKQREILVTNAKGIHHIQMSEYTLGVILQLARKTVDIYKNQQQKVWDNQNIRIAELYDSTIGIVGMGSIGEGIAEKAKAFNMRVLGMNTDGRPSKNVDQMYSRDQLEELLAESDYVVLIVPLTEQTYHLIKAKELNAMKESAYLINIARGEVIDDEALIQALTENKIAGAVLDVFQQEPLPESHPYWELDNVIITPHMSGKTPKYIERALEIFKKNLVAYTTNQIDQLINVIDLNKKY